MVRRPTEADAFDRIADLIISLLEAGHRGVDALIAAGIAHVASATTAYVDTGENERHWTERDSFDDESVRQLASRARTLDMVITTGEWRLAAPLRGDGQPIGAFVVERPYPFTRLDVIALLRAGTAVGQALLWAREIVTARQRITELERLAYQDETTGLANRRALQRELDRREAHDVPLALLFIDFDGLRAVNNQLSYEHGDQLLRALTAEIEQRLRPDEFAARLHGSGGDEFIVVCPVLDPSEVIARTAELERRLSPVSIDLPSPLVPLYGGASVGYAVQRPGEDSLDLVERAAALMRGRKAQRKLA